MGLGGQSALGQKQTSQGISRMSALPPKADIDPAQQDVRFVPKADIRWLVDDFYWTSSPSMTKRRSVGLVGSK